MTYIKKIDSLRGIAVLMVIIHHWIPKTGVFLPLGAMGVNIFYVISGFLITRILLVNANEGVQSGVSKATVLRNFILRRALRIFPIYYLSIFLFWLLRDYEPYQIQENLAYYLTYTVNILYFLRGKMDGYLSHLWSLSVEEQFYLVWPFVLIFLPQKHIFKAIIISIVIGFLFPFLIDKPMVEFLTPSCMSALGLGALLAWLSLYQKDYLKMYGNRILMTTALVFFISLIIYFNIEQSHYRQVILRSITSVFAFICIAYCVGVYKSVKSIDFFLNASPLVFIGKISYGLYLYHPLSPIIWRNFVTSRFHDLLRIFGDKGEILILLIAKFLVLICFAWISYVLVEMKFLSLKRLFVIDHSKAR